MRAFAAFHQLLSQATTPAFAHQSRVNRVFAATPTKVWMFPPL